MSETLKKTLSESLEGLSGAETVLRILARDDSLDCADALGLLANGLSAIGEEIDRAMMAASAERQKISAI